MADFDTIFMLLPAIFVAYVAQTTVGFGGVIVALGLGAIFAPIDLIIGGMLPVFPLMDSYLLARNRGQVAVRLLLRQVLPAMVLGMALGLLLLPVLGTMALETLLGPMIMVFALRELWLMLRPGNAAGRPIGRVQRALCLALGGVVHVLYTTGGPFLVYVVSRSGLDKGAFRASMCAVWLPLNTALAVAFVAGGRINAQTATLSACLLPVLALALWLGEKLHNKVNEFYFKLTVDGLLLASGAVLALKHL